MSHDKHAELVSQVLHLRDLHEASHTVDVVQFLHHFRFIPEEWKQSQVYEYMEWMRSDTHLELVEIRFNAMKMAWISTTTVTVPVPSSRKV